MMINATYADTPTATYVSTLVENFIPSPNRVGALLLPDWNFADGGIQIDRTTDEPIFQIEQEISRLQEDDDEDSPPSSLAASQTVMICSVATSLLANRWQKPRIATDGYDGLRLNWRSKGKEVRAVINGREEKEKYLYWEDEGSYGSVRNFTGFTLFSFLDALTSEKPFPRS
jgi:hypothetical protein